MSSKLRDAGALPLSVEPDAAGDSRRDSTAAATDEELVARFVAGESSAFEEILGRYRDRVYQLVRWYPGTDAQEAEEVAQEVFVQVYRSARRFRGRSKFRTWLFALTRNVCRHQLRLRSRASKRRIRVDAEETDLRQLPDGGPGPLDQIELDERRELLRRAVERLDPLYRTVLMLRDWEELSYREIAEVLGIPLGTVRSRLHNARAALAAELKPCLRSRNDGV